MERIGTATTVLHYSNIDELAKSHKPSFSVIPAEAGIQVPRLLDTDFRRYGPTGFQASD